MRSSLTMTRTEGWNIMPTDEELLGPARRAPPIDEEPSGPSPKPKAEPKTTASGIAASAGRGAAPYAAGATIGAAVGAPLGGIGAVPGALTGVAAVGLTQLSGDIYNWLGSPFGHFTTPQEATDRALDVAGVKRPSTPIEGLAEAVGGMATGALDVANPAATIADLIVSKRPDIAASWVDGIYATIIKPRRARRDPPMQRRQAISDIVSNRNTLQFTDPTGKVIAMGRLPESIDEFLQAIDQTKIKLLGEWDYLSQTGATSGAQVDLAPVIKSLRRIIADDPSIIRDDPEVAKRAADTAERYETRGTILPLEAQRELFILNQNLRGYYQNPVPAASVDEKTAEVLRDQLDKTIENTRAPAFRTLRARYGALRAVENDVNSAAQRIANQPGSGQMTYGTLLSLGADLVTGNARAVSAGLASKALSEFATRRADPNEVIKRMFRTAKKHNVTP
jgi:hypothetical protein